MFHALWTIIHRRRRLWNSNSEVVLVMLVVVFSARPMPSCAVRPCASDKGGGKWIWMKCCVSTDVGTWTNWLTFKRDPDYSRDAGTGLLSPLSYISADTGTRNFTLRKSNVYVLSAAATRGFTVVLFTESVSRRNTFVGGTCAPPSALLVLYWNEWTARLSMIRSARGLSATALLLVSCVCELPCMS